LNKNKLIAGVDEVGRGSWIGPVFSAAVILKKILIRIYLKIQKKYRLRKENN
jgi:ribonuclease HII